MSKQVLVDKRLGATDDDLAALFKRIEDVLNEWLLEREDVNKILDDLEERDWQYGTINSLKARLLDAMVNTFEMVAERCGVTTVEAPSDPTVN